MTRKICIFTGTRADWGHMYWIAWELRARADVTLQIVASGTHLDPRFGATAAEIEAAGFTIDARVPMPLDDDSPVGTAGAMAACLAGCAEAFNRLSPDLLLVLGDRYEGLAAASAAMLARMPIAHVHGGEVSEGAFDDCVRHAITKLAHLHFPAAEPYAERIVRMGEDASRVFCFGAPGLDHLGRTALLDRNVLELDLGIRLADPVLLVTYHPATLGDLGALPAMSALLAALDHFPEASVVITGVNADPGNHGADDLAIRYAGRHPGRVASVRSLGQTRYLSVMSLAAAVLGNSSSGLIEAPAMGIPTVNVGPRQDGRLKAASVIDCAEDERAMRDALEQALRPEFRRKWPDGLSLYGQGDASRRIADTVATMPLSNILVKRTTREVAP